MDRVAISRAASCCICDDPPPARHTECARLMSTSAMNASRNHASVEMNAKNDVALVLLSLDTDLMKYNTPAPPDDGMPAAIMAAKAK